MERSNAKEVIVSDIRVAPNERPHPTAMVGVYAGRTRGDQETAQGTRGAPRIESARDLQPQRQREFRTILNRPLDTSILKF